MSHRLIVRSGATLAAVSLAFLAVGPAFAADPVAQATATAVTLGLAGQSESTGSYAVTNDGTKETTSGINQPVLGLLGGQTLIQAGTLSQDAGTAVTNGDGTSDACAGLAGPGASLAAVGSAESCLTGGNALQLDAGNIDLSGVTLTGSSLLAGILPSGTSLTDPLNSIPGLGGILAGLLGQLPAGTTGTDPIGQVLDTILGPVSGALGTVLGTAGIGVTLNLGAVTAQCHATPTAATGIGKVADLSLNVALPAPIGNLTVPVSLGTGENVPILTGLDQVVDAINSALQGAITGIINSGTIGSQLSALLTPLGSGLNTVINAINDNAIKAIAPQLAPLEDNVLKGTLNKTSHTDGGKAIDITALDLQVLPAASAFVPGGGSLISLDVGHVTCGPNGRYAAPAGNNPGNTTPSTTEPVAATGTPTTVKSGIGSLEDAPSSLALAGLAGLAIAGASAGAIGFRRSLRQR